MARIYLATSWKNPYHSTILNHLRTLGHQVYDFKSSEAAPLGGPQPTAFSWGEVGIHPDSEYASHFRQKMLDNPRISHGYLGDFRGMEWADTCVLLLPAGNSAHLELGYMKGRGKRAIICMPEVKPDLMYLLADNMVTNLEELEEVLK